VPLRVHAKCAIARLLGQDPDMKHLPVRAVRWVDDEPFPGLVEVHDADDVLRVDSHYPVDLEIPVEVIAERSTPEGDIAVIKLPWGLSDGQVEPIEVHTSNLIDRA
jgi:hypothetical protein